MAEATCLDELSPFFSKAEAKAIIVTDVKLDDALCLWHFFKLNFSRPARHKVDIKVFVIGIKDAAGGIALANFVFSEAKRGAEQLRGKGNLARVKFEVLTTRLRGPVTAVRHELDTYAPFNNKAKGFPQAKNDKMKYFQDFDAQTISGDADFIGVISQYFKECVLDSEDGKPLPTFNADLLDYIVPKAGGLLAIQMGFNTRLPGSKEEQLEFWNGFLGKLKAAGAKTAFISNAFSFAKGDRKPGTIDPETDPLAATLKKQSPRLWEHLLNAGKMESSIFACDQMAKWVSGSQTEGMDAAAKVAEESNRCRASLNLGDSQEVSQISKNIKAVIETGSDGVQKVLKACADLHCVAEETCGEAAGYLGRAKEALKHFGRSLEITDGQQMMALFQSRVPILHPVKELEWLDVFRCYGPVFGEGDNIMWAAKDVDVPQSFVWLEKGLDLTSCYSLTLGKNSSIDMRVTTKKPMKFYESSACSLLQGVEVLHISGLGSAVSVACNVSAAIESKGSGVIEKIETDYVDPNGNSGAAERAQPQIKFKIRRKK